MFFILGIFVIWGGVFSLLCSFLELHDFRSDLDKASIGYGFLVQFIPRVAFFGDVSVCYGGVSYAFCIG